MSISSLNMSLNTIKTTNSVSNTKKEMCNLKELIKDITHMLARDIERKRIDEEILTVVISILSYVAKMLQRGQDEAAFHHQAVDVVTECFRTLRNGCAGCERNQDMIQRNQHVIEDTKELAKWCIIYKSHTEGDVTSVESSGGQVIGMLRCGMQFLGNLCTNHLPNQSMVWQHFSPLFSSLLELGDPILCRYCCMVIHTCLDDDRVTQLVVSDDKLSLVHALLAHMAEDSSEWGLYITEKLLLHPTFMSRFFEILDHNEIHLLLDVLITVIEDSTQKDAPCLSQETIHLLSEQFVTKAHIILGLNQADSQTGLEPMLVVKLLELLCVTSGSSVYNGLLQQQENLLKCSVNLLHCIHAISIEGSNPFASVAKLSSADIVNPEHPSFGLKKNLIRLIGNMGYKNKKNQDKVRDLGGISLILNHTTIDRRNPYITQWAVFAIKNLLEGNSENQNIVAQMNFSGLADNVSLLQEFGVQATVKDGKVVVTGVTDPGPQQP